MVTLDAGCVSWCRFPPILPKALTLTLANTHTYVPSLLRTRDGQQGLDIQIGESHIIKPRFYLYNII